MNEPTKDVDPRTASKQRAADSLKQADAEFQALADVADDTARSRWIEAIGLLARVRATLNGLS